MKTIKGLKGIKGAAVLSALLAASIFASACSDGGADSSQSDDAQTLKVFYWDDQAFMVEYGSLFNANYPNIEIEVVGWNELYRYLDEMPMEEALDALMQKEAPDVLALDPGQFRMLAGKNALKELDSMMEEKDFHGEEILPGLVELLKEQGGGKLYGLAPAFSSTAVYYNKEMFAKHGVELPAGPMSWKDIIDLAKRFPNKGDSEKGDFGLAYSDLPSQLGLSIGWSSGLLASDAEGKKITLSSDGWKKAFETALDAREAIAPIPEMQNGGYDGYMMSDPFNEGRAAMTVNRSYYLDSLLGEGTNKEKKFEVGLVPGPADPNDIQAGGNMYASEIFAIRANSENAKAAWELVKFINSDNATKFKSRSYKNGMFARTKYIQDVGNVSKNAFYALKPTMDLKERLYAKAPESFPAAFIKLVDTHIKEVTNGKRSLEEALKMIETEAQAELEKDKPKQAEQ